jgi:nicotinate-nucleotide--dimethylbenzimidazole phosphoribosyltransferase
LDYKYAINEVTGANEEAMARARAYCDTLIKPLGSLGRLEELAVRLAGITGCEKNRCEKRVIVVMAADNGVYVEGIAAAPQAFTLIHYNRTRVTYR